MKFGGASSRPRPGQGRSRQAFLVQWGLVLSVVCLLSFYIFVMYVTFRSSESASTELAPANREAREEDGDSSIVAEADRDPIFQRRRKIILSTGHGTWARSSLHLCPSPPELLTTNGPRDVATSTKQASGTRACGQRGAMATT
jgi:hypothetical protein